VYDSWALRDTTQNEKMKKTLLFNILVLLLSYAPSQEVIKIQNCRMTTLNPGLSEASESGSLKVVAYPNLYKHYFQLEKNSPVTGIAKSINREKYSDGYYIEPKLKWVSGRNRQGKVLFIYNSFTI
jgi:hypothetical protein